VDSQENSKERYMAVMAPLMAALTGENKVPIYEELIKADPDDIPRYSKKRKLLWLTLLSECGFCLAKIS